MIIDKLNDFDQFSLTLINGDITCFTDGSNGAILRGFHSRLIKKSITKLYVIKDDVDFLYIGTTSQSLTSRFRSGLKAKGRNGYHGYKWKTREIVKLYVWCFPELDKIQIENIEAELVFVIRREKGVWPITQNEIHFNNEYLAGKNIAERLFEILV